MFKKREEVSAVRKKKRKNLEDKEARGDLGKRRCSQREAKRDLFIFFSFKEGGGEPSTVPALPHFRQLESVFLTEMNPNSEVFLLSQTKKKKKNPQWHVASLRGG